jgi:hypothetical protein
MNKANESFQQTSKEPTMDFVVIETLFTSEFEFTAKSEAAKKFTASRMGEGAVGFTLSRERFYEAVKAIRGENLTIVLQ